MTWTLVLLVVQAAVPVAAAVAGYRWVPAGKRGPLLAGVVLFALYGLPPFGYGLLVAGTPIRDDEGYFRLLLGFFVAQQLGLVLLVAGLVTLVWAAVGRSRPAPPPGQSGKVASPAIPPYAPPGPYATGPQDVAPQQFVVRPGEMPSAGHDGPG